MRIIRGVYKGRKIIPPKGFRARPTTDYAKESLFNILENRIDLTSVRVLDLFSGTGSISLEFLSRGCSELTAVEKNKRYTEHLKGQFENLFPGKTKVISGDVFSFCKNAVLDFDILFADPPFAEKRIRELPKIILNNSALNENALIIIEHPAEVDFSDCDHHAETRRYGHVHFSFFEQK